MILYFFVIFAKPVYADDFESTLDSVNNQYLHTIAFTVSDYPSIETILYEKGEFLAEDTDLVIANDQVESYVSFDGTRRIPMAADRIDAPPGTQVDIVYLYRNATGHTVDISKIDWILSRNNKDNGSLIDILNISGYKEGNLSYKYSNLNLTKSGIYKEYVGKGLLPKDAQGKYILDSVIVKNPLSIDDVKAVINKDGGVDFEVYIQNESKEYLNNLEFNYEGYEEIFNLRAEEEYIVKFSTKDVPINLGTFSIFNPNIRQICAVLGAPYYDYTSTNAIPVLSSREGNIVPGAMVQPDRDSFCIKRIPYTMVSNGIVLSKVDEKAEETETSPDQEIDVLGVRDEMQVLPKTGKSGLGIFVLLVVDGLLWYSFSILRRNYESKNTNTRICTKSK